LDQALDRTRSVEATVIASALSRQAIYDCDLNVWAYELRYLESEVSKRGGGLDTTSAVILTAFAEFGLERVVGKNRAFINVNASALGECLRLPVPSQRVTLQVRDYEQRPAHCTEVFRSWKDQGFEIALDAFELTDSVRPLLDIVDYVRLDFERHGAAGMQEHAAALKAHFVEPIAVGLTSSAQVEQCESMGFISFQGDFLFRPQLLKRKELPSNFVIISDLMAKLQDPDVSFKQIEDIVIRDAGLSVAVLRFLNSSAYAFRHEVSSVGQAVSLLGINEFAKWTLLVMLSARFEKPGEILTTALIRARTCENFSRAMRTTAPATGFMIGLLSVIDAILDQPIETLLSELPVSPEVRAAILEFDGPAGKMLEAVVAREQGIPAISEEEQEQLTGAWLEAVEWAERTKPQKGRRTSEKVR
jgi:c-di-GMP phosphodiesterase